jgi:hypothetical protein
MDYNTMQNNDLEEALQQIYVQILKNKALTKSLYDNIFDIILSVFIGLTLLILCNRFVPSNFLGYEGVQPYASITIATVSIAYVAYKVYAKKSKMRK